MFRLLALFTLIAGASYAAPNSSERVWNGLVPTSAGSVTNQFIVTQTAVVTVTVPYRANQFIYSGDGGYLCENLSRCSQTFPTTSTVNNGWIKLTDGLSRTLPGNLYVSTSYVYVRSGSTSNTLHIFEWSTY